MLRIYGVPISVHTRKVIVTAIEKGLAYEIVPVVPVIPSSLPANWPQLSPTGKIPVLADGDTTLADSTVICAYLDRTYPSRLGSRITPAQLRSMPLVRRTDAERSLALESQRLRQIETRIAQIETEGRLSFEDVVVRAESARRLLSLRRVVPSFAAARELIGLLRDEVRLLPGTHRSGQLIAVAHSQDFELDQIDVEFGITLEDGDAPMIPANSPLRVGELPAVERMAVCVRVGLPEDAHLVTAKIARFVEASGATLAGPSREVFVQPPRLDRMHEAVVEMQFPIHSAITS